MWLFAQLVATGAFLSVSTLVAAGKSSSGFLNKVVICTPSGPRFIVIGENGILPEETPGGENHCPWCLSFGKSTSLAVPEAWVNAPSSPAVRTAWILVSEICAQQNRSAFYNSRAPPH